MKWMLRTLMTIFLNYCRRYCFLMKMFIYYKADCILFAFHIKDLKG